jgi:hypothetical protein
VLESEVDMKTYMEENKYDSIIFIVSVELGEIIIKSIHDLQQLYQIYVYNPTNTISQWVFVKDDNTTNTQLCQIAYKSLLRTPTSPRVMYTNTH